MTSLLPPKLPFAHRVKKHASTSAGASKGLASFALASPWSCEILAAFFFSTSLSA